MKKAAIIDLGTNTFNLLIVSVNNDNTYNILHSGKLPAKLGEGGINSKIITPAAFQRGLNAFGEHIRTTLLHGVSDTFAFATSAVRNASNGDELVMEIKNLFGVDVKVIDGNQEAELIYLGVRQAVDLTDDNVLILDIGGGSNEIIIGNKNQYQWKKSYDLGVSRLLQKFNPSDPISINQIAEIEDYLYFELSDMQSIVEQYKPNTLIGSSGSFDTYRSVLEGYGKIAKNNLPYSNIPIADYFELHNQLLLSTAQQRYSMPGMEPLRVEMIVLASVFTNLLIKITGVKSMMQSTYSLKEGAIYKLLNS